MAFANEYTLNVDIKRRISNVFPVFKQGESAKLNFRVFDNSVILNLSEFTRAEITFTLPSQQILIGDATLTDGLIEYALTGVEMSEIGVVAISLNIYSENDFVSIQPFKMFIYDSMKKGDLSYIAILQNLINEVQLLDNEIAGTVSNVDLKMQELEEAIIQELQRQSAEAIRNESETIRNESETIRNESETIRKGNENTRTEDENNRKTDENIRQSAEAIRVTNENVREDNEEIRISNENVREDNEGKRIVSENNRLHLGIYNPTKTYEIGNEVIYNGTTYRAIAQNTGITPDNASDWIIVAKKGQDGVGSVSIKTKKFISTQGQKIFTLPFSYEPLANKTKVNVGGVPQTTPDNYTETNSTTITLNEELSSGIEVIIEVFSTEFDDRIEEFNVKLGELESSINEVENTNNTVSENEIVRQQNESRRQTEESNRQTQFNNKISEIITLLPNVMNLENVSTWNGSIQYYKNNIVEYNGSGFMALQDSLGKLPPTLPTKNNTYWSLLAQRGIDGTGSIVTVNGISPDVNGNVQLDLSGSITTVNNITPDTNGNVTLDANHVGAIPSSEKGVANGVATLNADGKVVDANGNLVEGKVTSVNGEIGGIVLSASDVDAYSKVETDNKISNEIALLSEELDSQGQTVTEHLADDTAHGIGNKNSLLTNNKASIVEALNELFTNANNGKLDIASVIGFPATSGDTFAQLKTHIQTSKNELATNLSAKGQSSVGTETLDSLVDKIAQINTGKKWATGTVTTNAPITINGLNFNPKIVIYFMTSGTAINNYWRIGIASYQKDINVYSSGSKYFNFLGAYSTGTITSYVGDLTFTVDGIIDLPVTTIMTATYKWYAFE